MKKLIVLSSIAMMIVASTNATTRKLITSKGSPPVRTDQPENKAERREYRKESEQREIGKSVIFRSNNSIMILETYQY